MILGRAPPSGEDFDAMMSLDLPNYVGGSITHATNVSKVMLYSDPLFGVYDTTVKEGIAQEFAEHAKTLYSLAKDSAFAYIFESEAALCELLSVKYDLGARTREAYAKGDKNALSSLLCDYDKASELLEVFYKKFRTLWFCENKPHGFDTQEIRIGALMLRLRSSKERIEAYINGEIDRIEELEEKLLDPDGGGEELQKKLPLINSWGRNASVNVISW